MREADVAVDLTYDPRRSAAHPALAYRARRPDPDRAFQGYTLFTPMFGDGTVYLLDMGGEVVHTWRLPYRPGLYGYLLDDGRLFYSGKVMEDLERFEGWPRFKAGAALEVDWSSRVLWEVQHPGHHHDARRLRNGNVLLLCLRPVPDASRARIRGGVPDTETPAGIYGDYLVERDLTDRPAVSPLRVGPAEIQACLEQLNALLKQDSTRANHVFRQVLEPITMTPVEDGGQRFYRATGAAKGAEMLNRLGLAQAVDFGGCGGPQPLAGTSLPVRDHGLNPCFNYDHVFAIVACGALHPQVIGVIKTRRAP